MQELPYFDYRGKLITPSKPIRQCFYNKEYNRQLEQIGQ